MTGQLKPSQGTVSVFGAPIWGHPVAYADIGYCPDQDAFYERMTGPRVGDGVDTADRPRRVCGQEGGGPGARHGGPYRRWPGKKIGAYSKGMRQRIKLAQALAHDPSLLLLDEPLAGMDPIGRRRTIKLIKTWSGAGKTVVVSSHILHEIELMTPNILLINNGRILAEGQRSPDS